MTGQFWGKLRNSLFVPELNVVLKCEELEHGVDDGDDEGEYEQVDVGLQEGLLDTVLVLVLLLLAHQIAENIEPVLELLGRVHLPLEHGEWLEGDGEVQDWSAATQK